jgi:hypothetical protein
MNKSTAVRGQMLLASAVIAIILLVQAAQTFYVLCPPWSLAQAFNLPRRACDPATYPFMQYPMYSQVVKRETPVNFFEIYAVLDNGTEDHVLPAEMGFSYWDYEVFVNALLQNQQDFIANYAARYEERMGVAVSAFRLEDVPWTLETSPPSQLERRVITTIPVER